MRDFVYYSFICLLLTSCSFAKREQGDRELVEFAPLLGNKNIFVVDIDNTPKEKVLYLSDYFKNVRAIVLENKDNVVIGRINKLIALDESILFLDKMSSSLFVFDKEGKFIRKIGQHGKGPGEYINLSDFTVDFDNKVAYLLDSHSQRINWYDISSGRFINSIRIANDYVRSHRIQYADGKMYADAYFPIESENNYLLRTINLASGVQDSCWMNTTRYNKGWNELHLERQNTFISNQTFSRFNQVFMDTVISITPEGITPYLAIQSEKLLAMEDLMSQPNKTPGDRLSDLIKTDKINRIHYYLEFGDYIYFKYHQGGSLFPVVFDTRTRKARIAGALIDDLVFTKDFIHTILPTLYYADSNGIYGILQTHDINRFLQLANDGYVSETMIQNGELMHLNPESNPVLFYYEH